MGNVDEVPGYDDAPAPQPTPRPPTSKGMVRPRLTPAPQPQPQAQDADSTDDLAAAAVSGIRTAAGALPKRDWTQVLIASIITAALAAFGVGVGGNNAAQKLELQLAELKQQNVELKQQNAEFRRQLEQVIASSAKTQEALAVIQASILQDRAVDNAQRHEARIIALEAAMVEANKTFMERGMKIGSLERDVERLLKGVK